MSNVCKKVGEACLKGLTSCRESTSVSLGEMRESVQQLLEMTSQLRLMLRGVSSESIGEMVESELAAMDKAIEEAAKKIEVRRNCTKSFLLTIQCGTKGTNDFF